MKNLDDELRSVLRREEPPAGFADRVLQRAARRQPKRATNGVFVRWAAAAMIVGAVAGGFQYREVQKEREERLRGEAAKEQVVQALRIAGSKLHLVQAKIKEIGS
jgi:anti-sigma factor RsiW